MKSSFPVGAGAAFALGIYVLIGFAYVGLASDWPPFWPPMDVVTRPVDAIANTGMAAVGITILVGLVLLITIPILTINAGIKILRWLRSGR